MKKKFVVFVEEEVLRLLKDQAYQADSSMAKLATKAVTAVAQGKISFRGRELFFEGKLYPMDEVTSSEFPAPEASDTSHYPNITIGQYAAEEYHLKNHDILEFRNPDPHAPHVQQIASDLQVNIASVIRALKKYPLALVDNPSLPAVHKALGLTPVANGVDPVDKEKEI